MDVKKAHLCGHVWISKF